MFTTTQQSQAAFTFAIDPNIPTSDPAVAQVQGVTCSVNLSLVTPPIVATTGGSGSVQLSSEWMASFADIARVTAGGGIMGTSPAEMIGPQALGNSQATLAVTYNPAASVLECAISIGASMMMGTVTPANCSLSLPLDTQAVEIVLTDWTFTQVWAPFGVQGYKLGATLTVTAGGTTHTLNAS